MSSVSILRLENTASEYKQKNRLRRFFCLSSDVWEKSHETSSLHCLSELSLIGGRDIGPLLCHEASVRIQEFLENLSIFVVDMLYIVLFEKTLF